MSGELTPAIRSFLAHHTTGVFAVHRQDGTIHQTVVRHLFEEDAIWISTEAKRLKARALQRDGWASYCVHGPEAPFPAVSMEGSATIHTTGISERTGAIFSLIFGSPVDPPLTDSGLASMDRVVIELRPARIYAVSYLDQP